MTTEITRKQAILLSVLGVVLVVVLFVQLLIRPLMTKVSAAKEQLEVLNQQYSDLLLQSQSYDQNIASLKDWKEKNGEETKKLFPLSDAERIDRFLTFVMNEVGVTVDGLNIGQTMQYYIDGEGNLVTASPDEVAGTTDSSASGTDASDGSTGDGSTGDGSTGDGSGAAYTATGEYCCDFTYTMEGTYQNMKQMLDFVNRVSFLGVTAYSFNSVEKPAAQEQAAANGDAANADKFQDWYNFTMTITAYMYQSPLETDYADDVDSDETTEEAAEKAMQSATADIAAEEMTTTTIITTAADAA